MVEIPAAVKRKYPNLFSPLKIGPNITLQHRIILSPHWNALVDPTTFLPNENFYGYYKERCEGGIAWVIFPNSSPSGTEEYYPATNIGWWRDEVVDAMKKTIDMIHSYGIPCSAQFSMPGNHQIPWTSTTIGDWISEPPISSSPHAPAEFRPWQTPVAKEMEEDEIERVLDDFEEAARRAVKAGCDGVESLVGHGKLPNQFFSPLLNTRTDKWGGDFDGRARFIIEIAKHLRKGAGEDKTVGIRINSQDFFPGSATIEDWAELARRLEKVGVDYISTTMGLYRTVHVMITSHYSGFEPGYEAPFTAQIKQAVEKIPVLLVGHINSPILAEKLLAEGVGDGILIARGLDAEPHFVKKIIEGREEDIRPCIRCNQGCLFRVFHRGIGGLRCMVNPTCGEEWKWGSWTEKKAEKPKKVLIIGGGAAGLECARVLAERGHSPTIYEKAKEVGGQLRYWMKMPGSTEVGDFLEWLRRQLSKYKVPINLGVEVTQENIEEIIAKETPDEIVIATGSVQDRTGASTETYQPIQGYDRPNVITVDDLFDPDSPPDLDKLGEKVVVYDIMGDRRGWRACEALLKAGKEVIYLHPGHDIATYLFLCGELYPQKSNLVKAGNGRWTPDKVVLEVVLTEVTDKGVKVIYEFDPEFKPIEIECDGVVIVPTRVQKDELYKYLKSKGYKVYLIGDAVSPRWLMHAVRDGYRVARAI